VREIAHVGERRFDGLQVDLEGVEQHGEHREIPEAADQVDHPLLPEFIKGHGEGVVRDEVIPQDRSAEPVGDLLVALGELRFPVLR
jgi:hypothetical protein